MLFLQKISWSVKELNEIVFGEGDTTKSLRNRICKCQANFFGHVTRTEKLHHHVKTLMIKMQ